MAPWVDILGDGRRGNVPYDLERRHYQMPWHDISENWLSSIEDVIVLAVVIRGSCPGVIGLMVRDEISG